MESPQDEQEVMNNETKYFKMLTGEVEGDRIRPMEPPPTDGVLFMVDSEENGDGTFDLTIRQLKTTVGITYTERNLKVLGSDDFNNYMNKALELVLIQRAKDQEMHKSVFFSVFDSYASHERYKAEIRKELVGQIEKDYSQDQDITSEFLSRIDTATQQQIDKIKEVRNSFTIGEVEALAFPYDKIEPMLGAINNLKQLLSTFNDLDLRYINGRLSRLSQRQYDHNHPVDIADLGRKYNQNLNAPVLPTFLDPALINQFSKVCAIIEEVIQAPKQRNTSLSVILINCLISLQSLFNVGLGNKLVLS